MLACQLNEQEEGVAPTDSRLRPDQRLMENGLWDEANSVKQKLEEKQRAVRRARENEVEKLAAQGYYNALNVTSVVFSINIRFTNFD